MDISKRLKELRKKMGFSQYKLSKESGVSQSYLSCLEAGKKTPTVDTLEKICNTFGISLSEFFEMNNDNIPDPYTQAIIKEIKKLDDEQKKSLKLFLSSI
jgi:transcriptional regulator with XRE-family HTH domain